MTPQKTLQVTGSTTVADGGSNSVGNFDCGAGMTGVVKITPSGALSSPAFARLDYRDGSGNWYEGPILGYSGLSSGVAYHVPFSIGAGGNGGDLGLTRIFVGGNAGAAVVFVALIGQTSGVA